MATSLVETDINSQEEQILFSLLEEENKNEVSFIQNYIFHQSLKQGDMWIKNLVEMACSQQWPAVKIVNLFVSFPQKRIVWDLLESFNKEVRESYWKQCAVRLFDLPVDDKIYALKQLLLVKRHFTALNTAALFVEEIPADLIVELLQKTATEKSMEDFQLLQPYDVEGLFKALDKSFDVKEEEIAQLEWLYLPILTRVGSERPPKMLHKELSYNPEFFAEVIKYIYKPRDESNKEEEPFSQELLEQRAHLAWELLDSWKIVPGSDDNGQIDYEKLKIWVDKARELCGKSDRKEVGDSRIGQILAYSKSEENVWPPEAVCKIIDEIQSDELDNGFSIGIYNKRGTVTKSPFEGGQQERMLAAQFRRYADKWAIRYPRTTAILTKVAEHYENEAKREDKEAERRDLEY